MELNFFSPKVKVVLSSLVMAVVLLLVIFKGISVGKQTAQSQVVTQIAENLSAGLQYFYQDQNRFPTPLEFSDSQIMLSYFSAFPPSDFISANCSQSFVYKRIDVANFQLNFCLPRGLGQYDAAWNTIEGLPDNSAN